MKYVILSLNRKIDRKDGTPLMTKERTDENGNYFPPKPYMIVNFLTKHEGKEIWVSHYDFDLHSQDWDIGSTIDGTVSQKGEWKGEPQYIFNRPKDQKDVVQKFMKRIKKNDENVFNPLDVPAEEKEDIKISELPF